MRTLYFSTIHGIYEYHDETYPVDEIVEADTMLMMLKGQLSQEDGEIYQCNEITDELYDQLKMEYGIQK